ncbi:hypothetical protein D3C71_1778840 [compost metagenome]
MEPIFPGVAEAPTMAMLRGLNSRDSDESEDWVMVWTKRIQEKRTTLRPMLPRSSIAESAWGRSLGSMTREASARRDGR